MFETKLDTDAGMKMQYAKGILIGLKAQEVGYSADRTWWAKMSTGGMLSSYEKLGYHANSGGLWQGLVDSGAAVTEFPDGSKKILQPEPVGKSVIAYHPEFGVKVFRRSWYIDVPIDEAGWSVLYVSDSASEGIMFDAVAASYALVDGRDVGKPATHIQSLERWINCEAPSQPIVSFAGLVGVTGEALARARLVGDHLSDCRENNSRHFSRTWQVPALGEVVLVQELFPGELSPGLDRLKQVILYYKGESGPALGDRIEAAESLMIRMAKERPARVRLLAHRIIDDAALYGPRKLSFMFGISNDRVRMIGNFLKQQVEAVAA